MAVEYVWSGNPDVDAALPLLRLGRLSRLVPESLVIDSDEGHVGSTSASSAATPRQRLQLPVCEKSALDGDESPSVAIDEGDLLLEDFDSAAGTPLGSFAPGSATPLHLMLARAQQCVVCLQDKAHTFVPPHSGGGCARDVSGHRFCTDCWIEFLYHSSRQQRCGARPAPLACPLCRGGIHVPDVWGATYVLPSVWMQPAADEEEEALGPLSEPAMVEEAEQLTLWAGCARRGQGRGGRDQSDHA